MHLGLMFQLPRDILAPEYLMIMTSTIGVIKSCMISKGNLKNSASQKEVEIEMTIKQARSAMEDPRLRNTQPKRGTMGPPDERLLCRLKSEVENWKRSG